MPHCGAAMSEYVLTDIEAGILLGALQSCEWDEPAIGRLSTMIAEAQQIVVHQPSGTIEESPQVVTVSRTLGQ